MDFDFDTGTIYQGLATLDVTALPPLGSGPANVLTIVGTGALTLPKGTALQRPAAAGGTDIAGMFRYNTGINQLEYFDSTTWQQLSFAGGAVSTFQTSLAGLTPSTATTGAVTLAGTLGATSGGTGATVAPTAGQFLYSSAGTTYAATTLSGVAVTTIDFGSTGLTPATPTSGAVSVAGTLVLANGGTSASLTAVAGAPVYSTGSAMAIGTAGTSGQAYISGGSGAPTWQSIASTLTTGQILEGDGAGAFTANGATFVGSPTFSGVTLSGTVTNPTDATTKYYVDQIAAGMSWKAAVNLLSPTDIAMTGSTGTLVIDGHGALVQADTGYRILITDQYVNAGSFITGNTYSISSIGTTDFTLIGAASNTVGLAFTATGAGAGSGTATNAGIYTYTDNGTTYSLARSTDADVYTELIGATVFVLEGTTYGNTGWNQSNHYITNFGDSSNYQIWIQFSGTGTYVGGTGITVSGNTISLQTPVSIANGGTALSTAPANGQLLIGNGTGYTLATLTDGTAINITEGAGTITIDNTGVTSFTSSSGLSINTGATGAVSVTNTGVLSFSGGTTGLLPNTATTGAITLSGTLVVGNGGTGVTSLTTNGVLYGGTTVGVTAAGATGEVLVGTTGSAPSWATLSGAAVTSFQTSLSGLTPATATTGAVTLAGTLGFASGGTGLTSLGTANQILGVNAGATALEYKTVTAGTAISVVHGAGVITINNTGVTGFSLNDNSTTPIYTVTPTTTTTGSVAATIDLNNQNANLVFAGPASGGAAEPTFRSLTAADLGTALQLYKENPSTPTAPVASGTNAVAIGSGATASATGSFAEGDGANASIFGQKAYANGKFTAGYAQHGVYILRNESTSATFVELFLDGAAGTQRLVMPNNSVFVVDVLVAGVRNDGTSAGAGYRFVGVAKKDTTNGSITFIGTPSKTVIGETVNSWDARISADVTNGSILIEARSAASTPVNWVATVMTSETSF
jgi:collagen type VII alpha